MGVEACRIGLEACRMGVEACRIGWRLAGFGPVGTATGIEP
jgi:hypothetical protein